MREKDGILIKETSEARSSIDELESRAGTNQADEVTESNEAGIIALGHNLALILTKKIVGSHGEVSQACNDGVAGAV